MKWMLRNPTLLVGEDQISDDIYTLIHVKGISFVFRSFLCQSMFTMITVTERMHIIVFIH